jgi:hypothetical protein
MARIRTIKPEFWTDEKLSLLDPLTRLVYVGLWSHADDAGRLVDNLKLLDGLLFPNTDDSCEAPLEILARLGRILRYRHASGQDLIQIVKWNDHQRVDHPNKYTLPGPEHAVLTSDSTAKPSGNGKHSRKSREGVARTSRYDLRPTTSTNDQYQRPNPTAARKTKARAALEVEAAFEQAWQLYPRRSGSNPKLRAHRAWSARIAEGVSPADLLSGVRRYVAHCEAEHKIRTPFVLQAATFFGPERRFEEPWDSSNGKPDDGRLAALYAEEDAGLQQGRELFAKREPKEPT